MSNDNTNTIIATSFREVTNADNGVKTSQVKKVANDVKETGTLVAKIIIVLSMIWVLFGGYKPEMQRQIQAQDIASINTEAQHEVKGAYAIPRDEILEMELPKEEIVEGIVDPNKAVKEAMAKEIDSYIADYGSVELQGSGYIWVEMGFKYNRHPFSGVAISVADTSLGKHLKTPFNYGNVGNWDDGRTSSFTSKEEGIESIFRAMTNGYLKNATKLCHLSVGGWNECPEGKTINGGKFYASSKENWSRNTNWAMSWMLGKAYGNYSIILSDYIK